MKDFHDLIVQRRSIRRYTDSPLSPDQVTLILQAGLLAPTSKSSRAWHFIAVEEKDMLERLAGCKSAGAASLPGCSLAIVVTVDSTVSEAWIEDAAVAATLMQLQAEDLGLGSCWVQVRGRFTADGTPAEEVVQESLLMPENITPVCIITIGNKNEERKPQNIEKLKWENVHIGKWSNDNTL